MLKRFENGPGIVLTCEEGHESEEFWGLWGFSKDSKPSTTSERNHEWDKLFLDLEPGKLDVLYIYLYFKNYESPHIYYGADDEEENKD